MKFKELFGTNKELEENGAWVEVLDTSYLIARSTSRRATKYRATLEKANLKQLRFDGEVKDKTELMIGRKVAAKCILDWKGLEDDDGKQIPYSPEKALELVTEHNDFFFFIASTASSMETYQADERLEDAEKN